MSLEKEKGRWAVVTDENSMYHVIPTFGPKHELTQRCWCNPKMEEGLVCVHGHEIQ